jgi:hypothetical protein
MKSSAILGTFSFKSDACMCLPGRPEHVPDDRHSDGCPQADRLVQERELQLSQRRASGCHIRAADHSHRQRVTLQRRQYDYGKCIPPGRRQRPVQPGSRGEPLHSDRLQLRGHRQLYRHCHRHAGAGECLLAMRLTFVASLPTGIPCNHSCTIRHTLHTQPFEKSAYYVKCAPGPYIRPYAVDSAVCTDSEKLTDRMVCLQQHLRVVLSALVPALGLKSLGLLSSGNELEPFGIRPCGHC